MANNIAPNYKKPYSKMTPEELQAWLHVNRKAHAYASKKNYKRRAKHRNRNKGED